MGRHQVLTHYTHWFQPLTGTSAEKHDAFFERIHGGRRMLRWQHVGAARTRCQQFPEWRHPQHIRSPWLHGLGPQPRVHHWRHPCIPTIFISYTGDALDYKMPLLRAIKAVDEVATAVCQYFDKDVTKVTCTLGWEQEDL